MQNSQIENIFTNIVNQGNWTFHLIFYRIPKNASTSVFYHLGNFNIIHKYKQLFQENCDKKLYRNWFDPTHAKPNEAFKILRHEIQNYKSFCIVRNPWDRAVSMYKFAVKENLKQIYQIKGDISFDKFCDILNERCDDPYFIAANKQVEWTKGFYPPKKIIRYENLQEEFCEMLKDFGALHIPANLPHLNKTEHSHYSDYYNPQTKKIISKVFEEDIDTFKYVFETKTNEKTILTQTTKPHKLLI